VNNSGLFFCAFNDSEIFFSNDTNGIYQNSEIYWLNVANGTLINTAVNNS